MKSLSTFLNEAYHPGTFNSTNDPFFGWCEKKGLLPCVFLKYVRRDGGNPNDVEYELRLVDNDNDLKEMKKAKGDKEAHIPVIIYPTPEELEEDPESEPRRSWEWGKCTEVGLFGVDPRMDTGRKNFRDLETYAEEMVVGYDMKEFPMLHRTVSDSIIFRYHPHAPFHPGDNAECLKELSIEAYDAKARSMYAEFKRRMK
jgi:hypothetical protein